MLSSSIQTGSRKSARLAHRALLRKSPRDGFESFDHNHVVPDTPQLKQVERVAYPKRRRTIVTIPFLSEEIIFNILVWLPADLLYNVMRFVCRDWYNIISDPTFIKAQLLRSTVGIFVNVVPAPFNDLYLEMGIRCDVQIREYRFKCSGQVYASCNGLVLFHDQTVRERMVFYVANPITKQQVSLPPIPLPVGYTLRPGLAYVLSTREYKVAYVQNSDGLDFVCLALTVGAVKSWRQINTNHISESAKLAFICNSFSFSIGAFIYWVDSSSQYVVALDMETEIMYQLCSPRESRTGYCKFAKVGSFLSWMARGIAFEQLEWQIWGLTEPKLGVWTKLFNIDLNGQRCRIEQMLRCQGESFRICPIGWLRNGELVIFGCSCLSRTNTFIAHNVKTGEISSFKMVRERSQFHFEHVNSLEWIH